MTPTAATGPENKKPRHNRPISYDHLQNLHVRINPNHTTGVVIMELVIIAAILGCIPGAIASSKGRSFGAWWFYGFLLFIVALIHSLCIKKNHKAIENTLASEGLVKCPFCAEMIKPEAIKCKHCGSDISPKIDLIEGKEFNPSSMPFDAFFTREGDGFAVNESAVKELVQKLKKSNPGVHPLNLAEKYREQIEDLKNQLPSTVRPEFIKVYNESL